MRLLGGTPHMEYCKIVNDSRQHILDKLIGGVNIEYKNFIIAPD